MFVQNYITSVQSFRRSRPTNKYTQKQRFTFIQGVPFEQVFMENLKGHVAKNIERKHGVGVGLRVSKNYKVIQKTS